MAQVAVLAVTTAITIAQQRAQARAQSKMQNAAMNNQIKAQNEQLRVQEKQQRDQQKQEQASARAGFGARGIAATGGSAGAMIDGIAARTDERIADTQGLSQLGIENLRANQNARDRLNLLQTKNSITNSLVGSGGQALNMAAKLYAS